MLRYALLGLMGLGLLVGVFFYGRYYDFLGQHWLRLFAPPNNQTVPAVTQANTTRADLGGLVGMTVENISATELTVRTPANQTATFSLTKDISVFSVVREGEVGRGFGDIRPGTSLTVYPSRTDAGHALTLAFTRDKAYQPSQDDITHSVSGDIVAVDDASVTITPKVGSAPVVIARGSDTVALATVVGGETGYPMAPGYHVIATGVTPVGDKFSAKLIVYIKPQ